MDIVRVKHFIKKPKTIIWIVVIIFFVSLNTLVSFVYAKDEPRFIPEETREKIREGVIEAIAEPIGRVLPNMKEVIVRAAWTKEKKENYGNSYGHEEDGNGKKDTKDWPTYVDEETGVSFKYPEGWIATKSENGVISFSPNKDSYDDITIYKEDYPNLEIENWWNDKYSSSDASYELIEEKKIGNKYVYIYEEKDGYMQKHYVFHLGIAIYNVLPTGIGYENIEEVIINIK